MNINNASRKDIHRFQQWLKTLPKTETYFLYQTYLKDDQREEKLKQLFSKFSSLPPSSSSLSGGTSPLPFKPL